MLFGFGTPVLFRTAHLNHNMMVMYATFGAFLVARAAPTSLERRCCRGPGGAARVLGAASSAGIGVMCDYSGVVPLAWLFAWIGDRRWSADRGAHGADPILFAAGAAIPILVQLQSQWASFGSWLTPPQTWMAAGELHRPRLPRARLAGARSLLGQPRRAALGRLRLRAAAPARAHPAAARRRVRPASRSAPGPGRWPPSFTFMLFAAANQYGRMQWNTGVRYLMPVVPFLFLAAANHLARMRGAWLAVLGGAAVLHSWVVSMRRRVRSLGRLRRLGAGSCREGPRLPWLDVLARTATGRGSDPGRDPRSTSP